MPRQPEPPHMRHKGVHVQQAPNVASAGPQACVAPISAAEAFLLLFDLTLINELVANTTAYARAHGAQGFSLSIEEFYTYLSILLAMCLHPAPCLKAYWSTNPLYNSSFIYSLMGRQRWLEIHRWLHMNVLLTEKSVSLTC